MTLNVMGLDLSMTATGICLPDGRTLTVATDAKTKDMRLRTIRNAVADAIQANLTDLVVMEEAPPGLKGPAIKAIHMVQGAVRTCLLDLGVPYAVVNPSTLKRYATGKPGADKTAMAMAAYKRAGLEFKDDNQCDAWWLRAMGLDRFGIPPVSLPAAQCAAVDAVVWPDVGKSLEELRAEPGLSELLEQVEIEEYTITGTGDDRIVLRPVTPATGACVPDPR